MWRTIRFILLTFSFTIGCRQLPPMQMEIVSIKPLTITGASGIELINETFYVVGDNSPWLFLLGPDLFIKDSIQISPAYPGRMVSKEHKSDFEAIATNESELLLFGSGSKRPRRDSLVRITTGSAIVRTTSLSSHYDRLRKHPLIARHGLNIEGAAIQDKLLYLLNRGGNLLLEYDLEAFLVNSEIRLPGIIQVKLPEIAGIEAGFSGADLIPGTNKLIFTASVENTTDWISDGPILGSFIGMIDLKEVSSPDYVPLCTQINQADQPLLIKAESVTISHQPSDNGYKILMVTDSDDGNSEIISGILLLQ